MTDPALRVSRAQLDEIASGTPGPETLDLLLTGQAALRRLLLLAVRRRLGAAADPAFTLLGTAAVAARTPVEEIVTRPFAHAWATRVLAADPERARAALDALATAAAIRAGLEVDTALTAAGGELFLPGVGRLDGLHCTTVTVRQNGAGTDFGCPHPGASPPRRHPARTVTVEDGWTIGVEDLEPGRDSLGAPRTLSPGALRDAENLLREAWAIIRRHHRGYAPAVRALFRSVAPLTAAGTGATSSSSPLAAGCVAMDLAVPAPTAALLIIHEVQHSLLAAAEDLVPFCTGPAVERYRAPWKPVPRPAPAMLQGVYAHASVIDYWAARAGAAPDDREAWWQFAYLREVTTPAIRALRSSTELTGAGRRLLDGLLARADGWADVAVPAAVAGLARRTGRVEAVRWRLGNLRAVDGEAARVAAAYTSSEKRPALAGPVLAARPPTRPDPPGGIVARLHAAGSGRTSTAPGGTAEAELARARQAVLDRPDDDEAWLALAAAHPAVALTERPDLVRAVFALLAGGGTDGRTSPDDLATWLSARWHQEHAAAW
ncbi:HEXXH motif-containing putative peptide modification protein [Actinoplanes sp. NBRC 101535]|uniref:aKG-HExxH-type peptide beta-hydroxylase n=1 Tax=Actinoplanes sp. NBRC 101535 TaxID=3032196 RepID=UPI0024A49B27|nr:HEXXH motif-containing putative peptide modification protein [Actinoplanes sp. NBRC 101535]GLY04365.1 HEXXH motif domain-containing protein [Actinoplanes sp. NBRC 101535]